MTKHDMKIVIFTLLISQLVNFFYLFFIDHNVVELRRHLNYIEIEHIIDIRKNIKRVPQ